MKVTLLFYYQKKSLNSKQVFFRLTHKELSPLLFKPQHFCSIPKKPIRGSTCPRYMIVNVHNWRRKSFSFETLDDGIHVSPQGVGGPIHALRQQMKLSIHVWICSDSLYLKNHGLLFPWESKIFIYIYIKIWIIWYIKWRRNVWHIHWSIQPSFQLSIFSAKS